MPAKNPDKIPTPEPTPQRYLMYLNQQKHKLTNLSTKYLH